MKRSILFFPLVLACSSGSGTVSISTWGEEFIEEQIPASDFADGWSVKYTKFLVVISDVTIADDAGKQGGVMMGSKMFDHTKPGKKPVIDFSALEAKPWTKVSYRIRPADASTTAAVGDPADLQNMIKNGYSLYAEATLTKGMTTKKLAWGFKTATQYSECKGELGGKDVSGALVTGGGTDAIELTIHGDHLFYDDLGSGEAKLRFDNLAAADADMDNTITLEEISAVKLVSLDPKNGPYGTAGASGVNDLGAFVAALSRTVGHFRGEGECISKNL